MQSVEMAFHNFGVAKGLRAGKNPNGIIRIDSQDILDCSGCFGCAPQFGKCDG
jgi:hypothetical protein